MEHGEPALHQNLIEETFAGIPFPGNRLDVRTAIGIDNQGHAGSRRLSRGEEQPAIEGSGAIGRLPFDVHRGREPGIEGRRLPDGLAVGLVTAHIHHRRGGTRGNDVSEEVGVGREDGLMPFSRAAHLVLALSVKTDYPDLLLARVPLVGKVIDTVRDLVNTHNVGYLPIAGWLTAYQAGSATQRISSIKSV